MSSKTSNSKNHNSHKFSNSQKSAANDNNNSRSKSNNKDNSSCKVPNKNQVNNNDDAKSASVLSNMSSYSLIDDDHIDDQETINVGNLIIDLESDLEKEKIENEQQANARSTPQCTTSNAASSTSSTSFSARASSSTNSGVSSTPIGKSSQKSNKHQNNNNAINSGAANTTTPSNNIIDGKNGHNPTNRSVFKTSADERGELKMRITRETKPGKSEHKIVTSPNQKSPTSSSNNGVNILSQPNCDEPYIHDQNSDPTQSTSSISSTKECGTSTSIGTITEPDCLGPCEPGTSVNLEGIVWQETEGGILVVNVTWRGKTYVGALLDCTKHDWAPPRLCDSPASDIDLKTHKGVRTKRIVTRSNGIGLDEKNLLQTTGKLRNGKGRRIPPTNDANPTVSKKQKENDKSNETTSAQAEAHSSLAGATTITNSETACMPMNIDTNQQTTANNDSISTSNIASDKAGPNSPILIGCNEPNCSKKYRNMNGLLYHQAHAHPVDQESNNTSDSNCSPMKDKNTRSSSLEREERKEIPMDEEDTERRSPEFIASKQNQGMKLMQNQEKRDNHSPSPQPRTCNNLAPGPPNPDLNNAPFTEEQRPNKTIESERRVSQNSNLDQAPALNSGQRSPGPTKHHHPHELLPGLNHHHHHQNLHSAPPGKFGPTGSGSTSKLPGQVPPPQQPPPSQPQNLPANSEEGMKPSGTSTGPPPAPHQANCYFNSAFLNNTFHPYALHPYFPRQMYDPLTPPVPVSSAAFLNRFMSNVRAPPPPPQESPSRLLSPSTLAKGLPPFPPFPKMDPSSMPPIPPLPGVQMPTPPFPGLPPMMNPPLPGGSPHMRMPSQGDPLLPPTSQSPFVSPAVMNPALGSSPVFREHFSRG